MILLPIVFAILGALLAYVLGVGFLGGANAQYLAVACLAGLDTVFGGLRSGLEGKFSPIIFFTGFLSNTVIAFSLAWLGDQIYINLFLGVALVLGARIFTNLSLIRRFLLTRWQDNIERRRLNSLAQQSSATSATPEANASA